MVPLSSTVSERSIPNFEYRDSYSFSGNIVVLVAGLGFSNSDSLFLAAGWVTLACVGNFANAYYLDKLGRIRSLSKFSPFVLSLLSRR